MAHHVRVVSDSNHQGLGIKISRRAKRILGEKGDSSGNLIL